MSNQNKNAVINKYGYVHCLQDVSNGQYVKLLRKSTEITVAADSVTTETSFIPAGAFVIAYSHRITATIPTATTVSVGYTGQATAFASAASKTAAQTKSTPLGTAFASATDLIVTPSSNPATATGKIRVSIVYFLETAPTS